MRKRSMSNLMAAALLIAGIGFLSAVSAQPTDAQIKKDLTGPKTVSVVLGKPGTRNGAALTTSMSGTWATITSTG